ncbi:hypothetical protein PspLS_04614 [Pyricularia sp. CBS 133598]|nr:hypothetical protein PspLS_04614 [Pyricularia sp. CBS 133598]
MTLPLHEKEGADISHREKAGNVNIVHPQLTKEVHTLAEEANDGAVHVKLGWRSWLVVLISCFAIAGQVFVVVAAGTVIAFIVRDLGNASIAGWIIQGPLLVQSVLSPIVGRLSDVLDRKYMATLPPLIALAGAVMSAMATSMNMLIGGGILIGFTLPTISIVQTIPSEILPLKYRAVANGCAFMGGAIGGLIGNLGAGAVTNVNVGGWRYIFWIQAVFHGLTSIGLFCLYNPPKRTEKIKASFGEYFFWACDPIGSFLFVTSATLMLLGLGWAGGAYKWADPHVAVPIALGLALMVGFCLYEWKGRSDGLVAHVFFRTNANFALSVFAFGVEGWIFYSAVNSIVPQMALNLGWENNSWDISIRMLSFKLVNTVMSIPVTWWATRYKDLRSPLLVPFVIFLAVTILYSCTELHWSKVHYAINVLCGIGQSGPLTLLVACVQLTAPHAFLATATGLAFSARALGGAFGSAVLNAIVNGYLSAELVPAVSRAATAAGLPESSTAALVAAVGTGRVAVEGVEGATAEVWSAAVLASREQYKIAYRRAWASVVPFVVLAIVSMWFLRGVRDLMTDKVEAPVEKVPERELRRKGED